MYKKKLYTLTDTNASVLTSQNVTERNPNQTLRSLSVSIWGLPPIR